MKLLLALVLVVLAAQRLRELRVAGQNQSRLESRGGILHGQGHYPFLIGVHVLWFLGLAFEGLILGTKPGPEGFVWMALFGLAALLRFWARNTLGDRWTTRVVVIPGETLVRAGPYRWLRHPNYLAVLVELIALPLAFGAWRTAVVCGALELVALAIRVPLENRALDQSGASR